MQIGDILENLKSILGGSVYNALVGAVRVIGIIVLAVLAIRLGSVIIKKVFEKQKSFKFSMDSKRIDTMSTLLVSVFRYTVYTIAGVVILSDIFQLKSVLAAAGIGGVAVGFGAQSLIKDVISGFFILMEDQFRVGDLVTIENMNGTVEEMELRVTKIRNFNGDLHILPNGEIKRVTNHTRGDKAVIVDIPIAYSSDIATAFEAANRVCEECAAEFGNLVEVPKLLGITDLGKESMNLRIIAKTLPNEQWEVERRIRRLIKEEFDKERIHFFDRERIAVDRRPKNGGGANA